MRLLAASAVTLLCTALASAQTAELRAAWVARDGLTSRAKIQSTLDQLQAANLNCVCVNVWSRGYTIHPSAVLEAACGVRQDPTFVGRDPLHEFLVEAHRRGIEVEAWLEYGFMAGWSGWFPGTSGNGPVLTAHPDWAATDQTGNVRVGDGAGGYFTWLSHQHPDARRFLLDLTAELVDRYDVDGIQWDRIRYPSTAFGYDPATVAAYRAAHNNQPPPTNVEHSAWKRWRADGLTAFAAEVFQTVKVRRPSVRVTNAPVPMDTAYQSFLQDWPAWLAAGSLDLCYPQIYRTTLADYVALLDLNLARIRFQDRGRIAPGVRAISGTPTGEVLAMVTANRARGLPGHVFWYAEGLYDDLPQLQAQHFQQAVSVPGQPAAWRPAPVVVEDDAPGVVATAAWSVVPGGTASGGRALVAPFGAVAETVVFTLPVPAAGLYDVLAHQVVAAGRSRAVPHAVEHAGGTGMAWRDQAAGLQAGWQVLGTVWLDPAIGPCTVTVTGAADGSAAADAAMLLRSRLLSGAMATVGAGTNGTAGVPRISLGGNAAVGGQLALQANRLPPGALALCALGGPSMPQPMFGGQLHVAPATVLFALADGAGAAGWPLPIPFAPVLRGLTLWLQAGAIDAGAVGGASLTRAAATVLR